jgi:selenophosphate synthase
MQSDCHFGTGSGILKHGREMSKKSKVNARVKTACVQVDAETVHFDGHFIF